MNILAELWWVFARIGAVTFGGGYAMVSLIERELSDRNWLTAAEFADIVAVSQMTPGPLALNVATYVGRQIAGIPGALFASFGLGSPAVIITALVLWGLKAGKNAPWAASAVRGIRAAVLGLIATAVLFFLETSLVTGLPEGPIWKSAAGPLSFSLTAALAFLGALAAAHRFKQGPIRVIIGAAVLGIAAYFVGI